MGQNDNSIFNQTIINYLDNNLDPTNNYTFAQIYSRSTNYYRMIAVTVPKESAHLYGEILSNGYQFQLYTDTQNASLINVRVYEIRKSDNTVTLQSQNGALSVFGTLTSSLYNNSNSYVSNFRLYTNNNPETRQVVLSYGYSPPDYFHGDGHAIAPSLDSPQYPTGATVPHEVPQFHTWNSYTWNTYNPPSFDTSTLESMVESLGDIITYNGEYLADGISGVIENLGNNLKNYIEDLGNITKYYGDLISGNIKDFAENIYDNIQELLEPIYTVVDLFVKPWDSEEFQQQLDESSFYGSLNTTVTQIRSFGTSLTQATEPENLTFTINLTGIGWGISEIDFNWIKPFRSIIRLIIGCVLVYWLAIEIITGLNNVIGSGGDNEE